MQSVIVVGFSKWGVKVATNVRQTVKFASHLNAFNALLVMVLTLLEFATYVLQTVKLAGQVVACLAQAVMVLTLLEVAPHA